MSEKPELIAKLRVGSIVSGECSVCHQVIVVRDPDAEAPDQQNDKLKHAFEQHTHSEAYTPFVI
jgi:hypothetical protein